VVRLFGFFPNASPPWIGSAAPEARQNNPLTLAAKSWRLVQKLANLILWGVRLDLSSLEKLPVVTANPAYFAGCSAVFQRRNLVSKNEIATSGKKRPPRDDSYPRPSRKDCAPSYFDGLALWIFSR
jgi:hypothetical protein